MRMDLNAEFITPHIFSCCQEGDRQETQPPLAQHFPSLPRPVTRKWAICSWICISALTPPPQVLPSTEALENTQNPTDIGVYGKADFDPLDHQIIAELAHAHKLEHEYQQFK
ncbi:hypothetical protein F4703DRAFT_1942037 [Phycomyces blakesleeanus]|uniref:Uncharacterized protein n=1 Tax=Phycomyces blakesleeanus (strain ATCC 8743b / DSM 1359 / FGSC 10004 / NBRC 33097 / NRRL 1555) TaxID=763407 RepID=A0A167KTH9_PHYB8|nr:hypothetical protein PHYBLDRAFT_149849 [Phycomyces blakesleeanus NRRL 1555(-)]OAD68838.1 hypothetical protein PHYBLDRAFT_149849 [Phycomyces blakesleeanus NRRL 1555(-)]|eukprot:XP_018286878.1 hypothetical protein PHYBLDRAFT_149849 [Phycomyces blakesleeanus NRRL 1555(-)]